FGVDMIGRTTYDATALLDLSSKSGCFFRGGNRWAAFAPWLCAFAPAAWFMQIQPAETPWYTGPFFNTWLGQNGMAWVVSLVLAGVLYLVCGGARRREDRR